MHPDASKKLILIVDDVRENIDILRNILVDYVKLFALDGAKALTIATSSNPPDLILLDIMMPGMDGYVVCQHLKADKKTKHIPVIFLTAKSSIEDETKGLALGAVDYITKPISPPVVLARVSTHLAMNDAYKQLERQFTDLQEMDNLRKDVDAITRHDLKSPIDGIIGCTDMLLHHDSLDREELFKFHKLIRDSAYQLREMVNLSLNLIKMERGVYSVSLKPTNLRPIIQRILTDHQKLVDRKQLKILTLINGHPEEQQAEFMVLGDETLCYTMIANVCKNAMEASTKGQCVTISLTMADMATISIHNQEVIPEKIIEHFFDKYVTFGKKGGTGLGTYSARLMAETQKGGVQMRSLEGEGTTLTFTLHTLYE